MLCNLPQRYREEDRDGALELAVPPTIMAALTLIEGVPVTISFCLSDFETKKICKSQFCSFLESY